MMTLYKKNYLGNLKGVNKLKLNSRVDQSDFIQVFTALELVIFLLYNNIFIYQVICTLIYRRRSLYSFLTALSTVNVRYFLC